MIDFGPGVIKHHQSATILLGDDVPTADVGMMARAGTGQRPELTCANLTGRRQAMHAQTIGQTYPHQQAVAVTTDV